MSAVGRLGVNELAGIAVGWTVQLHLSLQLACGCQGQCSDNGLLVQWFNLVRCFCFGLSGAYDTLGSQAYGSGNKVTLCAHVIILP